MVSRPRTAAFYAVRSLARMVTYLTLITAVVIGPHWVVYLLVG